MSPHPPLGLREKLSYGFGDLASVLYWQTFMVYLLYFYTDVFGITAAAVGTMMIVTRWWDSADDAVMGMIADRTQTRWGKFRPYLLWGCVPFAVVGVLTFTTPDFGPTGKLVWAYVTFSLIMILYTVINIPYTALLGVITPDAKQRTSLSSIKFLFAFSAGAIVSATLLPLVQTLGGGNEARGWQLAFVVYGVAAVVFFLITFYGTRERVQPPPAQKTSIRHDLGDLVTNRPWLILLLTTFTFILFVAVRGTIKTHYFKYYVGTQEVTLPFLGTRTYGFEALVSAFNTLNQFVAIIGVLLVSWFAAKVGKKAAFIALFALAAGSTACYYLFRPEQLGLIFGFEVIGAITGGPLSALLWAMYADTADYAEWKAGRRATGLIFSASTAGQKFGWMFGGAAAAWLLGAVGFQPNVEQTDEVKNGILLMMSIIPAAVGLLSIVIVFFYPLSEDKVTQIEADLKARRAAAAQA